MKVEPEIKKALNDADPLIQGYVSQLEKRVQMLLREL